MTPAAIFPVPPAHLESALARVSDAVITSDRSDRVTYLNGSAEELTGMKREAAVGQPLGRVLSIVDASSGGSVDDAVAAARSTDDAAAQPKNAVLLGGLDGAIIVEYCVTAIRDQHGGFAGAVTVFSDVMRRRTAEIALQTTEQTLLENAEALFEEKERAQVTLHSIGDAVISIDFRGKVRFLNIIAEKMTGWTQADAAGRLLEETLILVDSTTREHLTCPAMQSIIENQTVRLDKTCALIHRDGTESAVEMSSSPIHDKHMGVIGAVMVAHDVTLARDLSARLARLALHDNLTGLPNRTLLSDRLEQALANAQRANHIVSLLFIDLDRFKPVNDSLGHEIGDRLLQAVATRLKTCVRASDTLSRHGGDEFIILLAGITHEDDAALCAQNAIAALNMPFDIGAHQLQIGASVGIAHSHNGAIGSMALLRNADSAMYEAKAVGRNNFQSFGS